LLVERNPGIDAGVNVEAVLIQTKQS
jgi:hypothetical protein